MELAFNVSLPILRRTYHPCFQSTSDSSHAKHARARSSTGSRRSFPVAHQSSIETSGLDASSRAQRPSLSHLRSFGFDDADLKAATDGEWFGFEATFNSDGVLLPVPDRYVPDEFRDWGVAPNGFDVVSSSQITEGALYLKRTRALPSVGCEADAVVPEVSLLKFAGPGNGGFPGGCVSCGSLQLGKSPVLTILVNEKERVQLSFRINERIGDVQVFSESWGSEFCDGQVLPGCGGGDRFAEGPRMDVTSLFGSWEYVSEQVDFPEGSSIEQTNGILVRNENEGELMVLPKGLSVRLLREGKRVLVEVGWLCDDTRIVVERLYEQGDLILIKKRTERRTEVSV